MRPAEIPTQTLPPSSPSMEGGDLGFNNESKTTASDNYVEQEALPYGPITKTAYYNHASEKSISHAEAKLIYRRHILETSDQDSQEPITRARTASSAESDGGLKRVGSRMFDSTCI